MIDRNEIIRKLEETVVPPFVERGFIRVPLLPDEQKSGEMRHSFPLGRLRRVASNSDFQLVEIQLDKHGTARCRLNFGIVPAIGVQHPIKHVPQEEACVHYLDQYCELYSRVFLRRWFSPSFLGNLPTDERHADKMMERIVLLSREVLMWFESGTVGPHVRVVRAR